MAAERTGVLCCRRVCQEAGALRLDLLGVRGGAGTSFLARPGWENFRSVISGLRKACPAAKPVVIRTAWLRPTTLGECVRRPRRFVVRLNRAMDQLTAIETLCHEWAHALAWNYSLDRLARMPKLAREEFDLASHDEVWGCAYSRVWRAYVAISEAGGG